MRRIHICIVILGFLSALNAQNGRLLSKVPMELADSDRVDLLTRPFMKEILDSVDFYRIIYESDGLKITGYMAEPKKVGPFPAIIANRGGNRDFGAWQPWTVIWYLGRMASWGYVVVASQYRGSDGSEGMEQFGGADINDVINLFPLLTFCPNVDTSRIGMEGGSRGGMMTYLAMKQTCRLKAAVVVAGAADAFSIISARPDMETDVYAELIPDYQEHKEKELIARSAVRWADSMCQTTPFIIDAWFRRLESFPAGINRPDAKTIHCQTSGTIYTF